MRNEGKGRSPSWGAWIETYTFRLVYLLAVCRSPSWGAWIETSPHRFSPRSIVVAPPRGERGLKHVYGRRRLIRCDGRSPSWGAWIETVMPSAVAYMYCSSLPLVGSVD